MSTDQATCSTVTVEEAQAKLKDLIRRLAPGDTVIITENERPVAKLLSEAAKTRQPRRPGNCKDMVTLLVEDDEHLEGFADYMQ